MFPNLSNIVIPLLLVCAISVNSFRQRRSTVLSHSPQENISDDQLYNYVIEKFTVPVDHFNSSINKTFEMRYLINNTWQLGENPPIFFYTGNEGDITGFVEPAAFIYDIAPKFGALIVFAEHRYYGESLPFGNNSFSNEENRSYLSSRQAIHDYIDLIEFLKSDTSMKHSPVIAFGGSYGGMLSAWMRMKYPNSVFSNGLLDPRHTGGILENLSDSVIAVIISEGAHQLDLAGSDSEDPESVIGVRKIHEIFIAKWIQEYRELTATSHIQIIGRTRGKLD